MFAADDPFCGIDLDDCIDEAGELKPWGQRLVDLLDSYSEISPSGTGAKVFLQASKPGQRCRKAYQDGEIEMYDQDRFFTVTGRRLGGVSGNTEPRQAQLALVYNEVFRPPTASASPLLQLPPKEDSVGTGTALSDERILEVARRSKSGDKVSLLWAGQWEGHFQSASEADSSLVFMLAFYTKDAEQIDRMFRNSGLMRPKWDEKHGAKTYGQMTIDKALGKVTEQYEPMKQREKGTKAPRPVPGPPSNAALPAVLVDDVQLADLTNQALAAIRKANNPPSVFVRAGSLARVVQDEHNVPKIDAFDRLKMRCLLGQVANFFRLRKGQDGWLPVATNPPLALAENLLALAQWSFPPLAGLTRSPILRTDGSICTTRGYDSKSGLYYCPDPNLVLTKIPEYPSCHEVEACVNILLNVIEDIPFADQASRANALAVLFSILMRPVIAGHIPLAIVDAPVQGTGKTLLITALGIIAVGTVAGESIPADQRDDEWRKKITSILLGASPFVLLDNIPDNTTIASPALAAALTTYEWSDRLLGRNESLRLPSRAVWVATGNNLRVAGDMPRRSYAIRLDANAERPWERTGFKIKGLEQYVTKNRGDLLSAALTIIRGWYVAGKPAAAVPTMGSFEEWASTVGSVLAFAGIGGFLDNLAHMRGVQDEDTQQWRTFFDSWWSTFGGNTVTVDDLFNRLLADQVAQDCAIPDVLLVQRDRGEGALRRSLGRHLSRLTGRICGGRKLEYAGSDAHRKVRAWHLVAQNNAETQGHNPANPANPATNPAKEDEQ